MNLRDCAGAAVPWRAAGPCGGGECVEAAGCSCRRPAVLVRDSQDPDGPRLAFAAPAWAAFTRSLRA